MQKNRTKRCKNNRWNCRYCTNAVQAPNRDVWAINNRDAGTCAFRCLRAVVGCCGHSKLVSARFRRLSPFRCLQTPYLQLARLYTPGQHCFRTSPRKLVLLANKSVVAVCLSSQVPSAFGWPDILLSYHWVQSVQRLTAFPIGIRVHFVLYVSAMSSSSPLTVMARDDWPRDAHQRPRTALAWNIKTCTFTSFGRPSTNMRRCSSAISF